MEENKKELIEQEASAEQKSENAGAEKCGFMCFVKKWLNLGLSLIAVLFAVIGKILFLAVSTSLMGGGNIAPSTITAMPWMDFIAIGFAVASTVLLCIKFIKNRKFEFSPELFVNLMAYVILLIRLTFLY